MAGGFEDVGEFFRRVVDSFSLPDTVGAVTVFRVIIHYREPTYEERTGPKEKPYRGSFTVEAENEEEAKAIALLRFKKMERLSGVGWVRQVTHVACEEVSR